MKGLAVTILLAILEITAISASSGGDLLTNGPPIPANRKEVGVQAEVLVAAERPEFAGEYHLSVGKDLEGRRA